MIPQCDMFTVEFNRIVYTATVLLQLNAASKRHIFAKDGLAVVTAISFVLIKRAASNEINT